MMRLPQAPVWTRQGRIIAPGLAGAGWSLHCQLPTPFRVSRDRLRMYYSSRDAAIHSHVFWVDLEAAPPWRVLEVSDGPVLAPGGLGAFDAFGVMPSSLVVRGDALWMYYVGWGSRPDVPYNACIGLARSQDGWRTFERFLPGPVVGLGPFEPYGVGSSEVAWIGDRWVMWYMSVTEWRQLGDRVEPRYHIKQAFSADGIRWESDGNVALDYLSESEGGIASPTVLHDLDGYWMWFCHRGLVDYRGSGGQAYRLGVAWSPDGTTWTRLPRQTVFSTEPAAGAFDQHMACYPAIYRGETEDYLFYNGSDFGQTGIGYAIKATR